MRTTVTLTDEAYRVAKAFARDRNVSLGRAMSDLIMKGSRGAGGRIGEIVIVDGWPTITIGRSVTSEDVRNFLLESE